MERCGAYVCQDRFYQQFWGLENLILINYNAHVPWVNILSVFRVTQDVSLGFCLIGTPIQSLRNGLRVVFDGTFWKITTGATTVKLRVRDPQNLAHLDLYIYIYGIIGQGRSRGKPSAG